MTVILQIVTVIVPSKNVQDDHRSTQLSLCEAAESISESNLKEEIYAHLDLCSVLPYFRLSAIRQGKIQQWTGSSHWQYVTHLCTSWWKKLHLLGIVVFKYWMRSC